MSPAKLAIMLQVCPLDAASGLRLTKIITSIESKVRDDIDFLVSARRDTNPETIRQIAMEARRSFGNVRVINGKRFGIGWPNGCNDLWQESMMRVSQYREAGKITASGVLTFESDCLPLRPDWLDALAAEWDIAKAEGRNCLGHAHTFPDARFEGLPTHINGNAVFACDVTDKYPQLGGCGAKQGWDAFHGSLLLKIGKDTPLVFQKYRIKSVTRGDVEGIRKDGVIPALFHGIKGFTGMQSVEDMIADKTFFSRA